MCVQSQEVEIPVGDGVIFHVMRDQATTGGGHIKAEQIYSSLISGQVPKLVEKASLPHPNPSSISGI